ncbi:MAG: DNA mismatch repair protein MutS [Actinomycetota bacterium]|nr:DNA mismatch repair protein MutS [Actinomycetota bacterium]
MTSTTIKVSKRTRDRLKAQAGAAHLSLGEHLTRLADAADRASRLSALGQAIAKTPVDLAAGYAAEAAVWEAAELNDARGA